jgi:hypothetical protein
MASILHKLVFSIGFLMALLSGVGVGFLVWSYEYDIQQTIWRGFDMVWTMATLNDSNPFFTLFLYGCVFAWFYGLSMVLSTARFLKASRVFSTLAELAWMWCCVVAIALSMDTLVLEREKVAVIPLMMMVFWLGHIGLFRVVLDERTQYARKPLPTMF